MDGRENKEYTPPVEPVKAYDFFAESSFPDVENTGGTECTVTSMGSGSFHHKLQKPKAGKKPEVGF